MNEKLKKKYEEQIKKKQTLENKKKQLRDKVDRISDEIQKQRGGA